MRSAHWPLAALASGFLARRRRPAGAGVALPLLLLLLSGGGGCSEERAVTTGEQAPELALVQVRAGLVDIQINGGYGLRALQAEVIYDPQQVSISKVEAGPDAARLDRLFFSELAQAQGRLVVGLSDTRRVRLPARGSLIRLHLQPVGGATAAKLELNRSLGARDGAKAVPLAPVSSEVTL